MKFEKWSLISNDKELRTISLVNNQPSNAILHISVEGPFKIISTSTNSLIKTDALGLKNTKTLLSNT